MRPTRHRRRAATDLIVEKRRARYARESRSYGSTATNANEWEAKLLSYGRLAKRDPWDCGSHCLLCHYDKFMEPRRAREKRAWRAEL